jgi:fucose permease
MPLLLLAYLGLASVGLPEGMLGVAWPHMRAELGEPVGAVGYLLVAGTTGYVLSSVAAGFTMDRLGVGFLLAGSTAISTAALVGVGLAPALAVVVAAVLGIGLGAGALETGLNSYVTRHFGARHITWMHASFGFGATVGPLVMTTVLAAGLVWRWGYGVLAAALGLLTMAFLSTAWAWRTAYPTGGTAVAHAVPERASARVAARVAAPARSGWRTLALPGLWLGAAAFAVQVAIEFVTGLWAYTLLTESRGVPEPLAGLAVSGFWGSMFVGRLLCGAVADRIGVHRVLTTGVAGTAVGAALVALPAPGWWGVAGLVLVGLAGAPMYPLLMLTTAERVGEAHADRAIGLQGGAAAVGGTVVPAGVGLLIGVIGPEVVGPSLLLLAVALGAVYLRSRRLS